jgi:enoyl-CoA hydratase/carnithine racemase
MDVLVTQKQRVLHLVLNRPHKRNALSLEMCSGIADSVAEAQANPDVGTVMISAAGAVFCAGMDLDEAAAETNASVLAEVHERLFSLGSRSRKPIVIAVNGAALGGGLGLVAQGHVVIAAEGAMFGLPEIKVGLWPFLVYRAVESALGARRTLELSLTGRSFQTTQACSWGLVHQVSPDAETSDRAKAIARELAKASPSAIEAGMTYVHETRGKPWEESGRIAADARRKVMHGADFPEGVLAFKQKREARWPSMPPAFYGNPKARE